MPRPNSADRAQQSRYTPIVPQVRGYSCSAPVSMGGGGYPHRAHSAGLAGTQGHSGQGEAKSPPAPTSRALTPSPAPITVPSTQDPHKDRDGAQHLCCPCRAEHATFPPRVLLAGP